MTEQGAFSVAKTNASTTISIDSLDASSFCEEDTNQLIMRCTEQDKTKYTIVFEESMTASNGLTDASRTNENKAKPNPKQHDRRKIQLAPSQNRNDCFIQSEYSASQIENDENFNYSNLVRSHSVAAKCPPSLSLPNFGEIAINRRNNAHLAFVANTAFVPLYDLPSSQSWHSANSEVDTPPSLIKLFIRNRSNSSSGQVSLSISSQESIPLTPVSQSQNYFSNDMTPKTNNNFETNWIAEETIPLYDENALHLNNARNDGMKINHRLMQPPIKEVDETLSDSSSRADVTMTSDSDEITQSPESSHQRNAYLSRVQDSAHNRVSSCSNVNQLRSSNRAHQQANRIINAPLSEDSTSSSERHSRHYQQDSSSSGRNASNAVSFTTLRSTATQIPVYIQDREVQAGFPPERQPNYAVNERLANDRLFYESPTSKRGAENVSRPLYVCYPNYSLPNLDFLKEFTEKVVDSGQNPKVYLSPTKHRLPQRENVKMRMRQNRGRSRPKSYTDYEELAKQSFNHIKDWDSLSFLLPNEFKELIKKIEGNKSQVKNQFSGTPSDPNLPSFQQLTPAERSEVKMRSPRKAFCKEMSIEKENGASRNHNSRPPLNKRYSLQEPLSEFMFADTNCKHADNDGSGFMTRSITMPDYHPCQWQQAHFCQPPSYFHHCCHQPFYSPPQCCINQSYGHCSHQKDLNTSSVDKLCQLLANDLSIRKVMNIIAEQSDAGKTSSQKAREQKPLYQTLSSKSSPLSEDADDGSNFTELRMHWENLAASPEPFASASATPSKPKRSPRANSNATRTSKKANLSAKPLTRSASNGNKPTFSRPTSLSVAANVKRKSMIPVAKCGQLKSPTGTNLVSPTSPRIKSAMLTK